MESIVLRNTMISLFLEITVSHSVETANQFLEATNWNLYEAIQLFFLRSNETSSLMGIHQNSNNSNDEVEVRVDNSLATMYRHPPINLMFNGTFEEAMQMASMKKKLLLVNLQSRKELMITSQMLNRDIWYSNEALTQIISNYFVFWQVYDDTTECRKVVSTYYNFHIDSVPPPVVLLLDPITGQKIKIWNGMIEPETLLKELVPFIDDGLMDDQQPIKKRRTDHHEKKMDEMMHALTASMETLMNDVDRSPFYPIEEEPTKSTNLMKEKKVVIYPALPEEPKVADREVVCRVGVRLPQDGRRVQRSFLRTNMIQLLWSFVSSQLDETADVNRPFRLTVLRGIPGAASKALDYESKLNFEESGLSNSMISVSWDD